MVEDRDELMSHAWPELRRFCRERQVELVEVDLRWGISEEQSTRKETLRLCLDEIRACRPYFVGLLGERYGWTPGDDAFTADLCEEQPWLKDLKGKSVTELEILHGVLNNPEMAGRAFFYFRDGTYAQARGADFQSEDPDSAKKQTALKKLIKKTCAARGIPLREDYPDPRGLAEMVLEDLQAAIGAQFPVEGIPDALTREARDHEAFAESRRRTYIGRPEYFDALDRHVAGDGGPLLLRGDSGSGKSALLANWIDRWRTDHPGDFIFQHYIGGTPDSADHWRLMGRLAAEIKRSTGDPDELPRTHEDILKTFPLWLAKARLYAQRTGVRCIIVLDALNQLEDRDRARLLGWLPEHPFTGPLRLIASTLPGDVLKAAQQRGWAELRVEPLTSDERRRMIGEYLGRFSKRLDAPRVERLAAAPAAANPLYLKILLDELRVTGTHEGLDERLGEYLAAEDIPALLRLVLARYRRDYERDRAGLVGEALALIWAARRGLSESELLGLLKPADKKQLPPAIWNPLRAALEESLLDRGGILDFAHDFLRAAVEAAFVPDQDRQDALRIQLADFFEAEPITARTCDELPWLLREAGQRDRLRSCLLDIDRFLLIHERDDEELRRYWIWLKDERTMGQAYLDSFDSWSGAPGREDAGLGEASNSLGYFLCTAALYDAAEPLYRRALEIAEKSFGPEHPNVATVLNNLAGLLPDTNRFAEAELLLRRAMKIEEKIYGPDHPWVARKLVNLGALFQDTNRLEEAEPLFRRGLAILERSLGPDHPEVATVLNDLAELLRDTNRLQEAERFYRGALEAWERSLGPDHPNVASALNNLARLLQITNRFREAELFVLRALEIDEKSYGPDHPKVAICLCNLAGLFRETNRLKEAEPLMRRALEIDENSLGPDHRHVATILNNLAELLQATKRFNEAELLFRRALEIAGKNLGPDHPDVGMALNNLALLLHATNRSAEAEPLMRRQLEIFLKSTAATGFQHPNFRGAVNNYGNLLLMMGRSENQARAEINKVMAPYGMRL